MKLDESDIVMLINYLAAAPSGMRRVPGQPGPVLSGEHSIILTTSQRDHIVNALRSYAPTAV
jgi:hypothetical protein